MFGSLSREQFLERYWQRAPILFRAALPGFRSPISPEELAGLAGEEEVESRLVHGTVETRFRLEHGPFDAARFERLPERGWTLLVQDVDKFVPALTPLLEPFRFIPDWRVDDIMVSFAAPGGSVGPHTDQYDVFLLQGQGRRRWQLSRAFDPTLRGDSDLKVLERFSPDEELIAEPGDILYLPPNVAHFGLALEDAMTFSIGFRAPDQKELMMALAEELILHAAPQERFSDAGRSPAVSPTELGQSDLARLRQMLRGGIELSDAALNRFIGRHLTRSKPNLEADGEVASAEEVGARLGRGETLVRRLGSRWAHYLAGDALSLFVDGHEYALTARDLGWLDPLLTGAPVDAAVSRVSPGALPCLVTFLERGSIEWQGDDD